MYIQVVLQSSNPQEGAKQLVQHFSHEALRQQLQQDICLIARQFDEYFGTCTTGLASRTWRSLQSIVAQTHCMYTTMHHRFDTEDHFVTTIILHGI